MALAFCENHEMALPKPTDYPFWFRLVVIVTLLLFTANLFFFLVPTSAFITWVSRQELLAGLSTLVGSFVGAWFAFRFAKYQLERERVEDNLAAGNRALFTLTVMYNELRQHQKEIIDPYRGRHDAWLNLHVSQPMDKSLTFDMKELSFFMQAHPTVFQQLFLEQERFRLAAYLVEEHRRIVLSDVWPRLEAAGFLVGEARSTGEIENVLGVSTVHQLKVITQAIITNFDEDVKSSMDVFTKVRAALKAIYPDRKFITFKPD